MANPMVTSKKIKFEKPKLIRIDLLDESALGDTGFGNEPPPPDQCGIPAGGQPPELESRDKWKSRQW